jgi:hypothetical protein
MSRLTFFADIAGQVTLDSAGSDRVTAAAVAIPTTDVAELRSYFDGKPKWRDITENSAESFVCDLIKCSSAIAIMSITKEPNAWTMFWESVKPLQDAIVRQSRKPAGFIKPGNAIRYAMLGQAFAMALGHAVRIASRSGIVDYLSRELIERTIVCDTDIQGDENISVFKEFWTKSDQFQPLAERLGFKFITRDVIITTEQQEPLLLLADIAAGIAHSALITNPGRLKLPVAHESSKRMLGILNASGKLVVIDKPFDIKCDEIYGNDLLEAAKQFTIKGENK